jgi:hypothetical protein
MVAIAAFSRSSAVSVVVPNSKDTLRTDSPVVEVAVVDSSPSRPITAFSITDDTCESTTSGEAPGYEVTMAADGISIDGINSCFKEPTERKPKAATMTVMRATTARLARESLERINKK